MDESPNRSMLAVLQKKDWKQGTASIQARNGLHSSKEAPPFKQETASIQARSEFPFSFGGERDRLIFTYAVLFKRIRESVP